ncbi:MAG: CDP-alcohol phosphatidyltransferase family protein [Candidatus Aminicenantes bacterium]|nr:CDP-alcohol phosphatidyltransferase family protein [Candidatus Aminicenantes bacterium]
MATIVTLPNVLSLLRLLLIPLIVFLMLNVNDEIFPYLVTIYIFAVFLDFLDGYIARRFSQESELGRIIDPLADKFLVLAILITLTLKFDFPPWLAVFIILRDILILWASVLLYKGKRIVKPSLVVGKFTFGLLSLLIFVFIFDLHEQIDLLAVKQCLITLTFSFLLWSWCAYFMVYLRERNGQAECDPGR